LLTGRRIASWEIVRRVVMHLGGDEADFLALWTRAVSDDNHLSRTTVSGGIQYGPVLQGRDFGEVHSGEKMSAAVAPTALAQLPAPAVGFTGREEELAVLAGLLDPAGGAGAVVVSAMAGLAGVGKTTLAVQAGHAARQAGWYPGGVLFIDLHGYDDQPVEPAQALDALLRGLGVPADHIPPTAEERAALYRSVLARFDQPVLIAADNASSEAQVRPLLPGAGPHRVLVTSRHTLAGLGARLVDLTVLDENASLTLLDAALRAARPGDDRITADPMAARRLAAACGGLPLALQITTSLLKADPTLTTAELAQEFEEKQRWLALLAYDEGSGTAGGSVATAFEHSYRRLDATQARVFRLISASPGPDLSTAAAAALTGLPIPEARRVLAELARAHLLEVAHGAAGRWRMHDLVRTYARQLSDACSEADEQDQARDRLLDHYLKGARAAAVHLRALPGMSVPTEFADREDALAWLDADRLNLIAAVTLAASTGREQIAIQLSLNLSEYLSWRRRVNDWLAITTISLDAARRLGDRSTEAAMLNNLGVAVAEVRRFEEAITAHQDAAAIFRETGDRHGEGLALTNLGAALTEVRRFEEAITAHQDAAAIFRETGDRHGEGLALGNLGNTLREASRFYEAITAHQDAAAIFRETGDRHGEGLALTNLGAALTEVRRFEEAITAHQDAAAIFRETGDRHGEGLALTNLGAALRGTGRFEEATAAHQDAAAISRETGDRHRGGLTLGSPGVVLAAVRRFEAITATEDEAADAKTPVRRG